MTHATARYQSAGFGWLHQTTQFSIALLRANLRNVKGLVITLGMPLFMLFTIWVPTLAGDAESEELMVLLFPAIVLLSSIMPGLTQATRLTRWKEQRIFRRLALTPVPVGSLILGAAGTQVVIGVCQGLAMLTFGVLIIGLELTLVSGMLVLLFMALAGATFVAFGSLIAAFSRKSDIAGYAFFFSIMPLTFLASFPPDMMPETLNAITPWLPTSMAIELIGPLFMTNHVSAETSLACFGLLVYTVLFASLAILKGRKDLFD